MLTIVEGSDACSAWPGYFTLVLLGQFSYTFTCSSINHNLKDRAHVLQSAVTSSEVSILLCLLQEMIFYVLWHHFVRVP